MFGKLRNKKAEVSNIVNIAIGLLIFAVLFPIAMSQIATTTTTSWNSAVATVFSVLVPILGAIAVALLYVKKVKT